MYHGMFFVVGMWFLAKDKYIWNINSCEKNIYEEILEVVYDF